MFLGRNTAQFACATFWLLDHIHAGDDDEDDHRDQLHEDDGRVEVRRLLDADDQEGGDGDDSEKRHEIEYGCGVLGRARHLLHAEGQIWRPAAIDHRPLRARDITDLRRKVDAVVLEEGDQRRAPARGDGSGAESVLEDEVPADDPGEYLAQRRVAIGVGRAGDGDHGGELGVAKSGKGATRAREDIGEHDGRPSVLRRGLTGEHEDARADNGADA